MRMIKLGRLQYTCTHDTSNSSCRRAVVTHTGVDGDNCNLLGPARIFCQISHLKQLEHLCGILRPHGHCVCPQRIRNYHFNISCTVLLQEVAAQGGNVMYEVLHVCLACFLGLQEAQQTGLVLVQQVVHLLLCGAAGTCRSAVCMYPTNLQKPGL